MILIVTGTIAHLINRGRTEAAQAGETERVRLGQVELAAEIRVPARHVLSLPGEAMVIAAIDHPDEESLAGLVGAFTTLLQRNPAYSSARWLDVTGRERIRVTRDENDKDPFAVEVTQLRDRSSQPYFASANAMAPGEISISCDTVPDGGAIVPVMRFATPVTDRHGTRQGLVVINVLMSAMLERFVQVTDGDAMLLDPSDGALFGPVGEGDWQYLPRLSKDMTSALAEGKARMAQSRAGHIFIPAGLLSWDTLPFPPSGLNTAQGGTWTIVSLRPAAAFQRSAFVVWGSSFLVATPLLVLLAILSWLIIDRSAQRLDALARMARADALAEAHRRQLEESQKVQKYLATLAAIVESSDDAIISKSLDSKIISWNSGAERLFGYTAEEMLGKSILLLFPPEDSQEEAEIIARLSRGETVKHYQGRRLHKDGHLMDVSVTLSPIRDDAGQVTGVSTVARDITAYKQEQEELERHRQHLEDLVNERTRQIREAHQHLKENQAFITAITDNVPGLVGYWDRDLRCRFANHAYLEWFGRDREEMLGIHVRDILGDEDFAASRSRFAGALAGFSQIFEREVVKPNGEVGYTQTHYIPDFDNGQVTGFYVLATDITPIKQAELRLREANQRLEKALAEAEAAGQAKVQFLANMSHEIRTPMNAVLGFLGLVLEGELSDAVRRQLTTAHNAARSLLLLLNDILDISKLQNGDIDLESIPFDLSRLLYSSLNMFQIKARDKKLDLRLAFPPSLPRCYIGDPMRIRQIVTNLVGNAVKFTDSGGVTLSVAGGDREGEIALSVADTGIGMTAEQIKRIFVPFVQADSSTTRRFGGTGLGVSICKQLAEHMGGRIWVESTPGAGSIFHVLLRLNLAPADAECIDEDFTGETLPQSPRHFRILLVEDVEENVDLALARLTSQGHDVTTAKNGSEAVELAVSRPFDLILMDVHMPKMNGLDATREIRQRMQGTPYHVPVVALTASVLVSEQRLCFEAGMDAFIGKPIDFGQLFHLMETVVPANHGKIVETVPVSITDEIHPLPPAEGIDTIDGLRRWGAPVPYLSALSGFATKFGSVVEQLRELRAVGDQTGAYELTHALKGVAGNLALTDVTRLSTLLNDALKKGQEVGIDDLLQELTKALAIVVDSIATLSTSPSTDGEAEKISDETTSASLADLREALDSDDPDVIEAALKQRTANLDPDDLARLRLLVAEYEFEKARSLVTALAERTAVSSVDI